MPAIYSKVSKEWQNKTEMFIKYLFLKFKFENIQGTSNAQFLLVHLGHRSPVCANLYERIASQFKIFFNARLQRL